MQQQLINSSFCFFFLSSFFIPIHFTLPRRTLLNILLAHPRTTTSTCIPLFTSPLCHFQVDAGLSMEIRKTAENFDHIFDLRTSKRVYYLVAGTDEEMNKWVECICSVCGLKIDGPAISPSEFRPVLLSAGSGSGNAGGGGSELLPATASVGSTSNSNNNNTINSNATATEERYSPQPSVSGSDSMAPTVMAPTPPPPPFTSSSSTSSFSSQQGPMVLLPPPPSGQQQQQQQQQPSPQIVHHQPSSSNSSSSTPPSSSSSSSLVSASLGAGTVLTNNNRSTTGAAHRNTVPFNEALLNYIPISECYTGTKPESGSQHSPPPPRPPKPRALQQAGKSQSSLALWPAADATSNCSSHSPNFNGNLQEVKLPPPPPHPQKASALLSNLYPGGYAATTHRSSDALKLRSSPLQYSKSLAMAAGINGHSALPPVAATAAGAMGANNLYLSPGSKGSLANSISLPPHNHNYEFCNANVVIGPNGNAFVEVPPLVNRSLKPHRRSASGRTSSMDSTRYFTV